MEEYTKVLNRFEMSVQRFAAWMRENQQGLLSWQLGVRELYIEMDKAKTELDKFHTIMEK